jgi:hypothetical protein
VGPEKPDRADQGEFRLNFGQNAGNRREHEPRASAFSSTTTPFGQGHVAMQYMCLSFAGQIRGVA